MNQKILKYKIPQKPLSVNEAWQGRRFASAAYKNFKRVTNILLNVLRPKMPPVKSILFAHYRWWVSNIGADTDNPVKPFQDVLFNHWNMKSSDSHIHVLLIEKRKTKKGDEAIEFHVDDIDTLIPYLEAYIAELKAEQRKPE